MQTEPKIAIETLKSLFVTTYQGSSTQSVHDAFDKLLQISLTSSNHFLGLCQTILEAQGQNRSLSLSVTNFIKVLTKKVVDQKIIDQCGPKNFINRIEHIFDNSKISPYFKQNIAISYIKAALHFKASFQKIIEKILYLYTVKDFHQAVLLSKAYRSCDSCLELKLQGLHYKKILPAEINYLYQEIKTYTNFIESKNNINNEQGIFETQCKIFEVLKNIHSSLAFLPFEKFETSIFGCLQKEEISLSISSLSIFRNNNQIMIIFRELIQKIVENLFRMRRIQKMPGLMKRISEILHDQWTIYQRVLQKGSSCISSQVRNRQNEMQAEQQLSLINLLTSGFSSHIIMIIDENIDIWNLFILPLHQMKVSIFIKNKQNVQQAFLILQDCTFIMKSQSFEVAFNKMVKTILDNYQSIRSKITQQLDTLLINQINNQISQNDKNKMLMLINFMTFQASHFLTQDSFIFKVQKFLKNNYHQLFNVQNLQIYFQSLLFLYHFIDDVFCQYLENDIFVVITENFIQHKNNINSLQNKNDSQLDSLVKIEKLILISFFSAGFSEKQVQKPSKIIMDFLFSSFDSDCLKVYTQLIQSYQIQDRITLQVFDKVLQDINELIFKREIDFHTIHEQLSAFIEFLVVFFDLDSYKHLFQTTLSRILPIFSHVINNKNQFEDDFFTIINNFTSHLEYVPQNYLEWMGNIYNNRIMESQQSFKSLAVVLKYLSPSKHNKDNFKYQLFVNCISLNLIEILVNCNQPQNDKSKSSLINQFMDSSKLGSFFLSGTDKIFSKKQICGLLCLHQLILYHSQYLTKKILSYIVSFASTKIMTQNKNDKNRKYGQTREDFSFQKGKYQLIFILLFKRRFSDVNQILVQKGIQKKVYETVYMKENHYLLEYDTPLLIKQQGQILRNLVYHDKYQMTFANTSFLAIFQKFSILFEIKMNNNGKCTLVNIQSDDSDDQDFETQSELKKQYREMTRVVLGFPHPKEWTNIDELKQMKELILKLRQNPDSKKWLEILYQNCFSKNQKEVMDQFMKNIETVNGKYRHIVNVNRSINPNNNGSHSINQVDI